MNVPYVKHYDPATGRLLNPIIGSYLHSGDNRRTRKAKDGRFYGNGKNFHLTVYLTSKFLRVLQREKDKDGTPKKIYHYLQR